MNQLAPMGYTNLAQFPVFDPATGVVLGCAPNNTADDARRAIDVACNAFRSWRKTNASERARLLIRWREAVLGDRESLARLITGESGKPLAEARREVDSSAEHMAWFAEEAKRIGGDLIPAPSSDRRVMVMQQPIGVVAAITPWNFPMAMVVRKVAPALAAGCSVVLKPAEETPLTALRLEQLAHKAGLPTGVYSVVTASRPETVADAMVMHPHVRGLSFTGSSEVGKRLYAKAARGVKRLSLELGGNAPFIVFDDAELARAADGLMASRFRNGGQTCVAANRIFVQDTVYEAFEAEIADRIRGLVVGTGSLPGVDIGPLINEAAVAKMERLVADACDKGARLVTGGRRLGPGSLFFMPTLISGVTADMALSTEEIFGPVVALRRFRGEAEVIEAANDCRQGLAGYFFSGDYRRAWRMAEALECGMVGVNEATLSSERVPFGGVKESGLGREGGRAGIHEFLDIKYVCLGGLEAGQEETRP